MSTSERITLLRVQSDAGFLPPSRLDGCAELGAASEMRQGRARRSLSGWETPGTGAAGDAIPIARLPI